MLQSRRQTREITIVGGSLSGLTFALACANRGICTRVLERSQGQPQGGGALGVDWELLARVVGQDPRLDGKIALLPVITSYRQAVARSAIHRWLREQVLLRAEIALVEGVAIQAVVENSRCAMAIMTGGWQIDAPVIVGADGVQSVVRHAIDPGHPHPSYAGYLLWRGLVSERDLPRETHWPANGEGFGLMTTRSDYLVAYPVAGVDGALEPGKRQISFSWYDPTRTDLLEASGCLSPTRQVLSSLAREHIPEPVRVELLGLARRIWPAPWRVFVTHALERHEFFATPVAEYFPRRLHGGIAARPGGPPRGAQTLCQPAPARRADARGKVRPLESCVFARHRQAARISINRSLIHLPGIARTILLAHGAGFLYPHALAGQDHGSHLSHRIVAEGHDYTVPHRFGCIAPPQPTRRLPGLRDPLFHRPPDWRERLPTVFVRIGGRERP